MDMLGDGYDGRSVDNMDIGGAGYSGKKVQGYMDIAGDGHRWRRGLVLHKATVMDGYRRTKLEVRIVILMVTVTDSWIRW